MKKLIFVAMLMNVITVAFANEGIKNGMPCLGEICIGDEIASLSNIKWEPSKTLIIGKPLSTMKVSDNLIQEWKAKVAPSAHGALAGAVPYLSQKTFDNHGIAKLSKVNGFCDRIDLNLSGKFKSESGYETRVSVNVEPGSDPSTQALRVNTIIRSYPQGMTTAQQNELKEQFKQRYAGIPGIYEGKMTDPKWKFEGSELWLMGPATTTVKRDMLKQYPGCLKTVKLD
ncbi:hypothetical protein [Janthinobacterium sp. 17J80-10]|uniref:hypothetical protein n=1 Tax=Janthinobacterium sp. 17J80-10 TaxID=2497863 RepID=UPI0010059E06|nr:hypothetical protein [Janthinobacterium sp. 17J80-10]QAU34485.1 hypothetical protein EKL02_10000 [Janthinobacterium sp. 17J80-10]